MSTTLFNPEVILHFNILIANYVISLKVKLKVRLNVNQVKCTSTTTTAQCKIAVFEYSGFL